jgi:dehydratase
MVGLLCIVPATTLATPAFATSTAVPHVMSIHYSCRINFPEGPFFENDSVILETDAPNSVEFGEDFKIVIKPPDNLPTPVPPNILELTQTRLRFDLPTNATFHSASLKGGSGFTSADVDEIDNGLLETVRGPVPGGGQFVFPDLTIKEEADFPDTEIVTRVGGTSFDDPGLEFDLKFQNPDGSTFTTTENCFPDQGTVLSTIHVGSENNNNGEHHGNKPDKPHKPNRPAKPHKVCD